MLPPGADPRSISPGQNSETFDIFDTRATSPHAEKGFAPEFSNIPEEKTEDLHSTHHRSSPVHQLHSRPNSTNSQAVPEHQLENSGQDNRFNSSSPIANENAVAEQLQFEDVSESKSGLKRRRGENIASTGKAEKAAGAKEVK